LCTNSTLDALVQGLKILISNNVGSCFFEEHQEMVVLVLVAVARDIPLNTKGARGGLTNNLVINTLRSILVDEQIAPEGEQSMGWKTTIAEGKRLMSICPVTSIKAKKTINRHKDVGGRMVIDGDRERGNDGVEDVVKVIGGSA
jgi:hypothetical protein